ncbi:aminotransferase class IV [Bosea sp. (in: a-proteobacteria)]|uniref:aminotransferase class IV n=1 Tax=Bosea sp. (in: a-proteobacteria) TaxID=1871050 RepID=UPI00260CFD39|nr:aminotransferase class IV [Bosea sp. (in: a-proteobacteria)]MCO5091229.1 aminotransferase class IV [Bosea sp. (in: a-proteobacteria)]
MSSDPETDLSAGVAFVDGAYVPLDEARIPLLDRGFLKSEATYDVVHVWKGYFFLLNDYVDRFHRSMAGLNMALDYSRGQIIDILHDCVAMSRLRDSYIQMTCTRGVPPPGSRDPRDCRNRFYAFAAPFSWIANEEQRRDGIRVGVASVERIPPASLDPRIKNFHWLDLVMASYDVYGQGALVPILPDRDGNITEGPGFNVFALLDGKLTTPIRGAFEGMTRRTVIELAQSIQIPVDIRDIPFDELGRADEIFISSTAGGVIPVTVLDGKPVGCGVPGPMTGRLHDLYWQAHEDPRYATAVRYDRASR